MEHHYDTSTLVVETSRVKMTVNSRVSPTVLKDIMLGCLTKGVVAVIDNCSGLEDSHIDITAVELTGANCLTSEMWRRVSALRYVISVQQIRLRDGEDLSLSLMF